VLEPLDWRSAASRRDYFEVISLSGLERFAATRSRIWLVHSNDFTRAAGRVQNWLRQHGYEGTSQGDFNRQRLILYQLRR
jgi:hypothetical protein